MLTPPAPMTNEQRSETIKALIEERRGHVFHDRTDRVKDVDEELRKLGYDAATPATRAEKRPAARTRKTVETR